MSGQARRSPSAAALKRRAALGESVRRARGDLIQADFGRPPADELGAPVPQTTISRWEKGEVELGLEQVRAVELVLGLLRGTLGRAAGYH
jgi:hypothetical protein